MGGSRPDIARMVDKTYFELQAIGRKTRPRATRKVERRHQTIYDKRTTGNEKLAAAGKNRDMGKNPKEAVSFENNGLKTMKMTTTSEDKLKNSSFRFYSICFQLPYSNVKHLSLDYAFKCTPYKVSSLLPIYPIQYHLNNLNINIYNKNSIFR